MCLRTEYIELVTKYDIHVDTRFIQRKVILFEGLSQIFHLVNALDYGTLLVLSFVLPDEKVLLYHDFQH